VSQLDEADVGFLHELRTSEQDQRGWRRTDHLNVLVEKEHGVLVPIPLHAFRI